MDVAFERRVMRLYGELLEREPETRADWLREACDGDAEVMAAVETLMATARSGLALPTQPPGAGAARLDAPPPARIGNYRILQELGRGGMGVVYLAERDDGLFEHKVAIKLIRGAMLSERAQQQFAVERRILARLRHPHIAQMLDGGVTGDGASYIVMELIGGQPITDYCAARHLPLDRRLALFAEVADAIDHAHRNLIVHADVKPSNVVVEDGFGVKLLDFGIARLVDDEGEAHGAFTPGFASPEREAGSPAAPADDIFALGRLLVALTAGVAGADEDLSAVCAKAAAADPAARYGTVGELLADVRRWQAHQPVTAAPPDRRRRMLLFWRRHRLATTIVGAGAAAVVVAFAAILGLYLQSEHRRVLADQRYAETRRMAGYIIGNIDPQLAHLPGSLPLRRQLLQTTGDYLRTLETNRAPSPALTREIAAGYLRMARIYGLDPSGGIGDMTAAKASLAHAQQLLAASADKDPDSPELLFLRGQAKVLEGSEIYVAPTRPAAEASLAALAQARALLTQYLRREPDDTEAKLELWRAQSLPARAQNYLGHPLEGLDMVKANLGKASMAVSTPAQRDERDFNLNGSYLLLGEAYADTAPPTAMHYFDLLIRNVDGMRQRGESDWENDLTQASGLTARGEIEDRLGREELAGADYRRAIAILGQLERVERNNEMRAYLAYTRQHLAIVDAKLKLYPEARQMSDLAVAWLQTQAQAEPQDGSRWRMLALILSSRAGLEDAAGDRRASCAVGHRADDAWASARRLHAIVPIDTAASGPVPKLQALMAASCGAPAAAAGPPARSVRRAPTRAAAG